jgi:hypothetical protein
VDADDVVDDELDARQADAGIGKLGELEGQLRVADVHHDLERQLGQVAEMSLRRHLVVEDAAIDMAGVAFGAADRDFLALGQGMLVASPQPTMAGMPSSRAMIAAWQVRPPRLVTMAAKRASSPAPSSGRSCRRPARRPA